ncbi:hypothetical protein EPI11_09925 [Flavobacterium cerinum]|uniref:Uncharacterized protein n=2 Tax=Flavobacterium cerinum TaxID=2502784 RepID=A0A3S3Q981_9FLAO|nr:hypothetical protein EPI11_09925 [Flavobacterium cerinum]
MYSKIYNYKNVGIVYSYRALHSLKFIDLIAEDLLDEYEIAMDFELKLIGKGSSGASVFNIKIIQLSLPEIISETLTPAMLEYNTRYQNITSELQIRLTENGSIKALENVVELKQKWISLKESIAKEPQTAELEALKERGELAYGNAFEYEDTLKSSLFFNCLFSEFYNRFHIQGAELSEHEVRSSLFPDLMIPVTAYFDYNSENESVVISKDFDLGKTGLIKEHFDSLANEDKFDHYFYQENAAYFLDQNDHLSSVELIRRETLNGMNEVIDHIQIWKQ